MNLKKLTAAAMTAGVMLSFIPMTSLAATEGWRKTDLGWRYYSLEKGYIIEDWLESGGKKYFFNEAGIMVAGVENFSIHDREYSFDSSGACKNPEGRTPSGAGWYKKTFCYCNNDTNSKREYVWNIEYFDEWYYFDSNGEPLKGWQKIGGKWYFLEEGEGIMLTGIQYMDYNTFYLFADNGAMATGWYKKDDSWYYARPNGILYSNEWLFSGGKWYYFFRGGEMACNITNLRIDDIDYSFDSSGACINPDAKPTEKPTGWHNECTSWGYQHWVYYNDDGTLCYGWKQLDGKWYFFDYYEEGTMSTGVHWDDYNAYFFDNSGVMQTGWNKVKMYYGEYWVYGGPSGALYRDKWLLSGGKWYYFEGDGEMVAGIDNYPINGKYYSFDSNGACKNPNGITEPQNGWFKRYYNSGWVNGSYWLYYENGVAATGWKIIDGQRYYFNSDGTMVCGRSQRIDDKMYDFDTNGSCMNYDYPRDERWPRYC